MNDSIERMSRAAYEKWIEGVESQEPPWDQMSEDFKDRMREGQRAAIEAIRVPTHEMVMAGLGRTTSKVWDAMVEELLK